MIIWLSGPYGVGKSTLAEALAPELHDALIFDAEEVGNVVRGSYPNDPYGFVFEDYPLWCEFCRKLLADVHTVSGKDIIVPMTLVRASSYEAIIRPLAQDGIPVHFIILEAAHDTVHGRILARGEEEDCWCIENIEMARAGASALPGGIHINTDGISIEALKRTVLTLISGK